MLLACYTYWMNFWKHRSKTDNPKDWPQFVLENDSFSLAILLWKKKKKSWSDLGRERNSQIIREMALSFSKFFLVFDLKCSFLQKLPDHPPPPIFPLNTHTWKQLYHTFLSSNMCWEQKSCNHLPGSGSLNLHSESTFVPFIRTSPKLWKGRKKKGL